jgi:mRNA interferase RelE/StbE
MAYTVEIEPRAQRQLRTLPRDVQRRITDALAALADQPRPPDAKRLTGHDRTYRIRVGAYRILYEIEDRIRIILIIEVGHRRQVYERFRRRRR